MKADHPDIPIPDEPRPSFSVVLRLEPGGPEIEREPIGEADLAALNAEAWLTHHLRRGRPDVAMADLDFRVRPVFRDDGGPLCRALIIESTGAGGHAGQSRHDIASVAHVAERASKRLIETGVLAVGRQYYYEVVAEATDEAAPPRFEPESIVPGRFTVRSAPLRWRRFPLPPLLARSGVVGDVDGWIPLLIDTEAYRRAERASRRGAEDRPPTESGGVLLGSLCSCPETGELFVAATDTIELVGAEEGRFSLYYSGETWSRIQAVVRARQAAAATRADRLVGHCHGHNFLPSLRTQEEAECGVCPNREGCGRTSAFISAGDLRWTRSVFSRQPWAFCQVFGLDARGGPVSALYGFRGGRLAPRGFHLTHDLAVRIRGADRPGVGVDGGRTYPD